MNTGSTIDLDLNIARARLVLAPATLLSVYIDSATPDLTPWFPLTGGLLAIDRYAFATLVLHLAYASAVHFWINVRGADARSMRLTAAIDVALAIAVALFTEGPTSPSFGFFTFAIVAVGSREGLRTTLFVTAVSMLAYLALIIASTGGEPHYYAMRPVYLGITGYLIAYLGEQRASYELRIRELEHRQDRQSIARSLHDGYIQALAGVNLRLSGCRQLLERGEAAAASAQLADLQTGVAREYDEVRAYIRSLLEMDERESGAASGGETVFHIRGDFHADGLRAEQILLIMLEGIRNTMQHASARCADVRAEESDRRISIAIDDDGVGFGDHASPPWSIASRAVELGGELTVLDAPKPGARLRVELPA